MSWLSKLLLPFRGRYWRQRWIDEAASHGLTQSMLTRAQNELHELKGGPSIAVFSLELINYGEQLGEEIHYRLRCRVSQVPLALFNRRAQQDQRLCVDYRVSREAFMQMRQPNVVLLTGIEQMGSQMGVQLARQLVPNLARE